MRIDQERRDAFAKALRLAMDRATPKVTQEELAEHLRVTQAAVNNWYHGRSAPSIDDVEQIEVVLELPSGWLTRPLGYLPLAWDERRKLTFEEFVELDLDSLDEGQKDVLLRLYRQFTGQ